MPAPTDRRLHILLLAVLVLITSWTFRPALHAGFVVWDDDTEITQNPHIQGLTSNNVSWAFTNYDWVRRYQPLDWLSWQLNYQIGGLQPFGYHLGNLLQHLACVVLLYFLVLKLLQTWQESKRADHRANPLLLLLAAAMGALWWGIHPLRVEPVVWVTGRIYTQCTMFLLAAMLTYVYMTTLTLSKPVKILWYVLSVFCFICSLLSYAIVVGGAVALLLLDIYPLRRVGTYSPHGWRSVAALRIYAEKIPYFASALAVGGVTLWARIHVKGIWSPPPTLAEFPLWPRIMQAFYVLAYYLYANWIPVHLSPVYTQLLKFDPNGWLFWLSAATVLALSALSCLLARRCPWLPIAWGYHLVMLAPLLGLSEHPHYTNDRYAQMESLVFAVLIAGAMVVWMNRFPRSLLQLGLPALGLLVIGCWSWLSIAQSRVWNDTETLYAHMLHQLGDDPYRADIQWRLSDLYLKQGRPADAFKAAERSLDMVPTIPYALLFLEKSCAALTDSSSTAPPLTADERKSLYLQVARAYDRDAAALEAVVPLRIAAKYYELAGDLPTAAARIETVISLETEDGADRLTLARMNHEQHHDADARLQLDLAVKSNPALAGQRDLLLTQWNAAAPAAVPPRPTSSP